MSIDHFKLSVSQADYIFPPTPVLCSDFLSRWLHILLVVQAWSMQVRLYPPFCHQGVIPKGRGINYNRFILFLNTVDSDKYNHLLFFPTCLQTWVGRNHGCAKDGFWYISPTVVITDALLSPVKFFFASMLSLSQHMGGILALGRCPVKVFQSPHHHCARPCAMEYMY